MFSAKFVEARKARVLFSIVFIFAMCNLPRIVLNLEEGVQAITSYFDTYYLIDDQHQPQHLNTTATSAAVNATAATSSPRCYSPPFWSYILGNISSLLLTVNASVCSIIYCVMCPTFRTEFLNKFRSI